MRNCEFRIYVTCLEKLELSIRDLTAQSCTVMLNRFLKSVTIPILGLL